MNSSCDRDQETSGSSECMGRLIEDGYMLPMVSGSSAAPVGECGAVGGWEWVISTCCHETTALSELLLPAGALDSGAQRTAWWV
jgi:hypothetical protein